MVLVNNHGSLDLNLWGESDKLGVSWSHAWGTFPIGLTNAAPPHPVEAIDWSLARRSKSGKSQSARGNEKEKKEEEGETAGKFEWSLTFTMRGYMALISSLPTGTALRVLTATVWADDGYGGTWFFPVHSSEACSLCQSWGIHVRAAGNECQQWLKRCIWIVKIARYSLLFYLSFLAAIIRSLSSVCVYWSG